MHSPVLQKEVVSRGERVGATVALGRLEGSQVGKPTLHARSEGRGGRRDEGCLRTYLATSHLTAIGGVNVCRIPPPQLSRQGPSPQNVFTPGPLLRPPSTLNALPLPPLSSPDGCPHTWY